MSLKRFWAVVRKEYRHILREPRALWMVFLSPAFVLIALSTIFISTGGGVRLALWDGDRSLLSRQLVATLSSDDDFVVSHVAGYGELDELLVRQEVDAAVVIPPGFGDALRSGESVPVQVILDGVDTFAAGQATGSLLGHAARFSLALQGQYGLRRPPLQVRSYSAYLGEADQQKSMIPGLIPIVFALPALAAALATARERETGSLESLLSTPVRSIEYLGGKLVAYVTTSLVGLLPVWGVAVWFFGVPFRGDPLLMVLLTALFLTASVAEAIFIGVLSPSQQAATVISLFVFFVPCFFLTGLIEPIDTTDWIGTAISYVIPSTHFVAISRGLFIKGASSVELWKPTAALLSLAAVWLGLGTLVFKGRV